MSLAIIIPALNEAPNIPRTLATATTQFPRAKLIVVDGGSADATRELAHASGATVINSPRGRGTQCAIGAIAAREDWLLFLHADTLLSDDASAVANAFMLQPTAQIATFRLRFDDGGAFLRVCGWFTRFDSVFTRFGDQGILIRRAFYQALGGFQPWPLFEDVGLLQRARKKARIVSLPAVVTTSARRFNRSGHIRQQLRNGFLLTRYLFGASPERLAASYGRCTGALKARTPGAETTESAEQRRANCVMP